MKLNEVFDKVLPWEWEKDDENTAVFTVDDAEYNVEFGKDMVDSWVISFGRTELGSRRSISSAKTNITGTGNQHAIFATVIDIIKNFIDEVNPDEMSFTAKKSEPSRIALYNRMMKMFPKDKWYTEITELTDSVYYTIMTREKWQHATQ